MTDRTASAAVEATNSTGDYMSDILTAPETQRDGTSLLQDMRWYRPSGDPNQQRLTITVPEFIAQAIDILHAQTGQSMNAVGGFLLKRGLYQFTNLPDYERLRTQRGIVRDAGSPTRIKQLGWRFQLATRTKAAERIGLRQVPLDVLAGVKELRHTLGFEHDSTAGGVCLLTALPGVPLPGLLPQAVTQEMRELLVQLHYQADLAEDLARRIQAAPPETSGPQPSLTELAKEVER